MGNDVPRNLNYFKRTDLLRMWDNVKPVLKDKDLMDMLLNFDIEGLNDNRVTNIRAVFANDVLMTFNVLIRESVVVAHLFEWINGVLEYFPSFAPSGLERRAPARRVHGRPDVR